MCVSKQASLTYRQPNFKSTVSIMKRAKGGVEMYHVYYNPIHQMDIDARCLPGWLERTVDQGEWLNKDDQKKMSPS